MLSGIKPSGSLTLGNYIGAIKPFVGYQDEYEMFVFIADLHAITVYQDPNELRENTKNLILTYLAAGLDPKKCTIFKQSDVPYHNQLEWVLTCNTDLPDLTKMPQYKNYQEKFKNKAMPTSILLYPSMMNSDILLYQADKVPVGQDQVPHILLTKTVANRFNKRYGETFKIPEPIISKTGAKIMSLSDPTKKMSKSESDKGTIYLSDSSDVIYEKIKRAKTDGENKIYFDPENKPGISNLLTIYAVLRGWTIEETSEYFKDWDYGKFKNEVAAAVVFELSTLQQKMKELEATPYLIDQVLNGGAEKAREIAGLTLCKVYKKIGIQ